MSKNSGISKAMILTYRFGNEVYYRIKIPFVRQILMCTYKICDFLIIKVIGGADLPAQAKIGRNLYLPHSGKGVVIHPGAIIGDDVTISHQVTIGSNKTGNAGAPVIGNNVFIGVGAKVLGRLNIGSDVKIGANAVVLKDLPNNTTAVGIPANIINHDA